MTISPPNSWCQFVMNLRSLHFWGELIFVFLAEYLTWLSLLGNYYTFCFTYFCIIIDSNLTKTHTFWKLLRATVWCMVICVTMSKNASLSKPLAKCSITFSDLEKLFNLFLYTILLLFQTAIYVRYDILYYLMNNKFMCNVVCLK